MKRPAPNEYDPFYAGYIQNISGDVIKVFEDQINSTDTFFKSVPVTRHNFRYAEGKWSIKEVLGHLIDNERIMSYRAMAISRGEKQALPGFDENDYIRFSNYDARNFYDVLAEKKRIREANVLMFKSFSEETFEKRGIANNSEVTVRALLYIITGHEMHHLKIIKERYLFLQE